MGINPDFNLRCPRCRRDDRIDIEAKVLVRLTADGTDAYQSADGSHEWDDQSACICRACDFVGKVINFDEEGRGA